MGKNLFKSRKGEDVRDKCNVFHMTAQHDSERRLLAALYRAIFISGGSITVACNNEKAETFFCGTPSTEGGETIEEEG